MAVDVTQKVITANPVRQGVATVYVTKFGEAQELAPEDNIAPNLAAIEAKYTNRFSSIRFYTGDSSS